MQVNQHILNRWLYIFLADNTHAWLLQGDGSYIPSEIAEGEELIDAQAILLERWPAYTVF